MIAAGPTIALDTMQDAQGQWVHLTPNGLFSGRDGRKWRVSDPAAVIKTTLKRQGDTLPIDYEHQTDFAPANGKPAPAAGWIKSLQSRSNGIWGRVEWTPKAAEHLAAREYRFLSPVIAYAPNGEVTAVLRAALTNNPNLELTALARANESIGDQVDDDKEIRALLGLGEDASTSDVTQAVRTLTEGTAQNSNGAPDPTKWVPMAVFMEATKELNLRNQGMTEELALNRVEEAMAKGTLFPFMKDWAVGLCRVNRPAFEAFISTAGGGAAHLFKPVDNRRPPDVSAGLSDLETLVARNLGHSAEEMRAHRKD